MHKSNQQLEEVLTHYGVKGMKWGVRRDAANRKGIGMIDRSRLKKMLTSKERSDYIDAKDKKWLDKVKDDSKAQKVAKSVAKDMKKVNKELKKEYGSDFKRSFNRQKQAQFQRALKDAYDDILAGHTYRVYKLSPSKTREVELKALPDGTMKATIVERDTPKLAKQRAAITKAVNRNLKKQQKQTIKHSDESTGTSNMDGMFFILTMDTDGFPDDVLTPFEDDIQQNDTLDDTLTHVGIKGMRWGVRRDRNRPGGADGKEESSKVVDKRGKLRKNLDSMKRERDWKKVLNEVDKLNTKDIQKVSKRIDLENDLKKLSKSKMAKSKDREDYLRREHMSDAELVRKVNRLRAKDKLQKSVSEASREQREFGEKVVNITKSIGVKYAVNRVVGKRIGAKDIFDSVTNPKDTYNKSKEELIKTKVSNDDLKDILKKISTKESKS